MKQLVLVRHSDTESTSFSMPDRARKLTPKGKNKAKIQASRLKKINLIPDLIITSDAIRAEETADIFSKALCSNCPMLKVPFLYEDFTTTEFFTLINELDDSYNTVFIVGHNPNISLMASRLDAESIVSFNTCSIGIFNLADCWSKVEVMKGKMIEYLDN